MRVHCLFPECTATYIYHKYLITHLRIVHNQSEDLAIAGYAAAKAEAARAQITGEDFQGAIILIILDLETTGLIRRDMPLPRIVELALKIINFNITFHSLINPGIPMPEAAAKVNHITDADLAPMPPFATIAKSMLECIDKVYLFIYRLVL